MTRPNTLAKLSATDPGYKKLYEELAKDPRLVLRRGGGGCLFLVFLKELVGPKDGFLRVEINARGHYLDWPKDSRLHTALENAFSPHLPPQLTPGKGDGRRFHANLDQISKCLTLFLDAIGPWPPTAK